MKAKKTLVILLSLIVLISSINLTISVVSATETASHTEEAVSFNSHWYKIIQDDGISTWQEAQQYCESKNGYLATITSKEENDFLYSYITKQGYDSAYFGFTDVDEEGVWKWGNGEEITYTNWHSGEPNSENVSEDYAMFYYKYSDGTWNDGKFGNKSAFICEWETEDNATIEEKNMGSLNLNWDLEPNEIVTYKSKHPTKGDTEQKAKINNYQIVDSKEKGYKELTFDYVVECSCGGFSSEEVDKLVEYYEKYGNTGNAVTWAVIDYDSGKSLECKNDKSVTVTCEYEWEEPVRYYSDSGWSIQHSHKYEASFKILFPEDYTGLCFGCIGNTTLKTNMEQEEDDFWKGKISFWDSAYYVADDKEYSNFMRVIPENDKSIAVFTTEPSLNIKTNESMWLAFGLLEDGVLDEKWKKMVITVSNPTVLSIGDYEKIEEGYSLEVKGKREGSSYITITDTESGISTMLLINVYDSYVRTYSYDIQNIEPFYPENKWENDIATNIYNVNGIYVNNYKCEKKGSTYNVSFNVYNEKYHTGAIDIYDSTGAWIQSKEIEKNTNISSLWDTGEQTFFLITDFVTGKMCTYEQASFSKHTPISFEVPEGGYFTISNNFSKSPGTFFYNTSEILFNSMMEFLKEIPDVSIEPSDFARIIMGEILEDPIKRDAWMEIFENFLIDEAANIGQKLLAGEVSDVYANLITSFENALNSLNINWKHLFESSAGVGEAAFTKFSGPAGAALEFCFSFAKATDRILQATTIGTSVDEAYVTVYSTMKEGEINPYGVVIHTNGNIDAESVLQVFKVSDSDIIKVALDGSDPLQKYEVYNISFVKNDKLVQPNGKVKVYLPIPKGMSGRTCNVYRQEEDGSWMILNAYIEENYLVFETDHFSMYAIVGNMEKLTISALPNKITYIEDDVLDTEGLILDLNGELITEGYICNPTVLSGNGIQKITVRYGCTETEFDVKVNSNTNIPIDANGWYTIDGKDYWYENGIRQGTEGRGKEIYDPVSDAWYWLDAPNGIMAVSKDVYQESLAGTWGDYIGEDGQRYGKWVRYDESGHMVKGWHETANGTYFFDYIYGTMAKGYATIEGIEYYFNPTTGILERTIGEVPEFGWYEVDGNEYWYENYTRQGYSIDTSYRGKEIYDETSNAWYWLDNVDSGKKSISKDVYQESLSGIWGDMVGADRQRYGKWVRYDENGHMVKGWQDTENGRYYFDQTYGTMAKGYAAIDGIEYYFNKNTGVLEKTIGEVPENGWKTIDGNEYWYENHIRQGYSVSESYRGKEIYDAQSDAWYWLDNIDDGKKAVSKDVYQESLAGDWGDVVGEDGQRYGKWVRYDENGHMVKGWQYTDNGTYFFDYTYGTMAKGNVVIDGQNYYFDEVTGVLR